MGFFESFLDGLLGRRRRHKVSLEAKEFKQRIGPYGGFYISPYNEVESFLSFIGEFFVYKKHEWAVIAFCRDNQVIKFWANKGLNNKQGSFYLHNEKIIGLCKDENYNKILLCHNHPLGQDIIGDTSWMSYPEKCVYYQKVKNNTLNPSQADYNTYIDYKRQLKDYAIDCEFYIFVAGKWTGMISDESP